MNRTTLIIGGCRSGKSRHALALAESMAGRRNLFLATCVPQDPEMSLRVLRHRQDRGPLWQTVEEPVDIDKAISLNGRGADVIVVDCLTLWIANLMQAYAADEQVNHHIAQLCRILDSPPCPVILVTNEVGAGIVPENALARRYRDLAGWSNQKVAAVCRHVVWMVAGIAVTIKPQGAAGHEKAI